MQTDELLNAKARRDQHRDTLIQVLRSTKDLPQWVHAFLDADVALTRDLQSQLSLAITQTRNTKE